MGRRGNMNSNVVWVGNRDRYGLYILFTEMGVLVLLESFPEKVSNMTKDNENEVGDVSCNQVKIRRLVHDGLGHSGSARMATDMAMGEISDASELGIALGFLLPVAGIVGSCGGSLLLVVLCPGRRDPDAGDRQRGEGGRRKGRRDGADGPAGRKEGGELGRSFREGRASAVGASGGRRGRGAGGKGLRRGGCLGHALAGHWAESEEEDDVTRETTEKAKVGERGPLGK